MRLLVARRASTGLWLPRMAASTQTEAQFATAVAAEMGVASATITATAITVADAAGAARVASRLASGVGTTAASFWPDGDPDGDFVSTGADVDAVTAARLKRLFGGAAEEHRSRQAVLAASALTSWPGGYEITADERAQAAATLFTDRVRARQADTIVEEARTFKRAQGWS